MAKPSGRKAKTNTRSKATQPAPDDLVGKRVQFDRATWDAVALLAREQMKDLAEISEEAFRDVLKKYGRSADFREALKMSARRASKQRKDDTSD